MPRVRHRPSPGYRATQSAVQPNSIGLVRVRVLVAAVTAMLTVVAASSARTSEPSAACTAPAKWSRKPVPGYAGSEARTYNQECVIGRIYGLRKTAREYGIRSSNWLTICVKVETQTWQPPFRTAAIAGCMRGFALWDKAH